MKRYIVTDDKGEEWYTVSERDLKEWLTDGSLNTNSHIFEIKQELEVVNQFNLRPKE